MTNGDPASVPQSTGTSIMALLGALAAAGGGRRGCVLRVAADVITFYCGGGDDVGNDSGGVSGVGSVGSADAGTDDDGGDGAVDSYLRAAAARLVDGHYSHRPIRSVAVGDYFRPVRSLATVDSDGQFYDAGGNDSVTSTVSATALANFSAGLEPFLNGSYNHTAENVENLTNYIFVITIGIILGAMILTTICGKFGIFFEKF